MEIRRVIEGWKRKYHTKFRIKHHSNPPNLTHSLLKTHPRHLKRQCCRDKIVVKIVGTNVKYSSQIKYYMLFDVSTIYFFVYAC